MPNWVHSNYAIKGKTEDVLAFINLGLRNSGAKEEKTIAKAIDSLLENGNNLVSGHKLGDSKTPADPVIDKGIRFSTFRPIPDTFLRYDTTNYPNEFPEAVKEQREKYGAVGWYDFNAYKWFGTKWSATLSDWNFTTNKGITTLFFNADTAWSIADLWLRWIKDTFPTLAVFHCSDEESGMFYCYGEIDDDAEADCTESIEGRMQSFEDEYDGDTDSDEYYYQRCEEEQQALQEMRDEFYSYVADYKI